MSIHIPHRFFFEVSFKSHFFFSITFSNTQTKKLLNSKKTIKKVYKKTFSRSLRDFDEFFSEIKVQVNISLSTHFVSLFFGTWHRLLVPFFIHHLVEIIRYAEHWEIGQLRKGHQGEEMRNFSECNFIFIEYGTHIGNYQKKKKMIKNNKLIFVRHKDDTHHFEHLNRFNALPNCLGKHLRRAHTVSKPQPFAHYILFCCSFVCAGALGSSNKYLRR